MAAQTIVRASILLVLALSFAATRASFAEAPPCDRKVSSRDHIGRGHGLSDNGQEEAALAEFQCAFDIDHAPEALAQIALAEHALGRWVQAEAHLTTALAHPDAWVVEKNAVLLDDLKDIRANLGDLWVKGTPSGAEVLVNGRPVGALPLSQAVRVPIGKVAVNVGKDGYWTVERIVPIGAHAPTIETVELVAQTPEGSATPRPPPSATVAAETGAATWKRPVAWIATGGAALSLAVGVTFHAMRQRSADEFNDESNHCGESLPLRGAPGCVDKYDGVLAAERVAIIGYAGAAGLGAAAMYLFLTAPPGPRRTAASCAPGPMAVVCSVPF